MSDVAFDSAAPEYGEMSAVLGLPSNIAAGDSFSGVINISEWDDQAGYKLIDFIMTVPDDVTVKSVAACDRLSGGSVSYNLEQDTGKLRVVYFDANENNDITVSGTEYPAELFKIDFKADSDCGDGKLSVAVTGMSVKLGSDPLASSSMTVVNTDSAKGSVNVVSGMTFSAVCLYQGDDIDLISSDKKAIAVAVTDIEKGGSLIYNDGENEIAFKYSAEITNTTGIASYVAMVSADIDMENFIDEDYFEMGEDSAERIAFGDGNFDSVINAQDALLAVDSWLRKGSAPDDDVILSLNINADSRLNTFDALGIVERFINGGSCGVVTKAANLATVW